jgi:hypothetical protein
MARPSDVKKGTEERAGKIEHIYKRSTYGWIKKKEGFAVRQLTQMQILTDDITLFHIFEKTFTQHLTLANLKKMLSWNKSA